MSRGRDIDIHENWALNALRDQYREASHAKMKALGINVILSPGANSVATRLEDNHYGLYTGLWNFLDHPSGIFPTKLQVDPALDRITDDASYQPRSDLERSEFVKCEYQITAIFKPVSLIKERGREREILADSSMQTIRSFSVECRLPCKSLAFITAMRRR